MASAITGAPIVASNALNLGVVGPQRLTGGTRQQTQYATPRFKTPIVQQNGRRLAQDCGYFSVLELLLRVFNRLLAGLPHFVRQHCRLFLRWRHESLRVDHQSRKENCQRKSRRTFLGLEVPWSVCRAVRPPESKHWRKKSNDYTSSFGSAPLECYEGTPLERVDRG